LSGQIVVPEITGLVDHDKVVGAPVECVQVEADVTLFTRKVGVMKDIIPELVFGERIQGAGIAVDGPVAA
jgi:hypothetical protein